MSQWSELIRAQTEKHRNKLLGHLLPTAEVSFAAEIGGSNSCRQLAGQQAGTEL